MMQMKKRQLGSAGPWVSALGLGCMPMSGTYGPVDEAEAIATIHRAIELGVNMLDTADAYGMGHNEELIGRAIRGRREKVALATKFGTLRGPRGELIGLDGSSAHVKAACEASLRRLDAETIDLFYLHRVDPKVPIEETVGAMAALVQEGKVRYLGLSEALRGIPRAHAVHPIAALQTEYSLWSRDLEAGALATCRALGIGVVAYSPIGRGFLAGAVQMPSDSGAFDLRRGTPRFEGENLERNRVLADALSVLASERGVTAAQLALAWVLSRGEDIVPIPGTRCRAHLEENLRALEIALDPGLMADLERLFPPGVAAGERYVPPLMASLNL